MERMFHSSYLFFKKINYLLIINTFFLLTLDAQTEWTVLVYVQAKNNLSSFALKNFSDMAIIGSNDQVNTLVQWYQPEHQGVWRYKVEKGKMVLEECNQSSSDGNAPHDLVDAMRWAATKHPAKKYSLILWNHGIGILDPNWGIRRNDNLYNSNDRFVIDSPYLQNNPRIQIDGLTMDSTVTFTKPIKSSFSSSDRGILFNEQSRTYMNNQSLAQALSEIKTKVLGNKKIDLLGMDACLMAMVEVGYLAHQYANVLVASQEVELAHGWNYAALMDMFSVKNVTADQIASGIVLGYEAYYKDKIPFYTQSAINLDLMSSLKTSINNIVTAFKNCKKSNQSLALDMIKKARRSCLQFSAPTYVDLHTFYQEIQTIITELATDVRNSSPFSTLKTELANGMRLIEKVVIANTAGKNLARAKGLSIYFPIGRIDASYQKTEFARDCLWHEFIQDVCS